MDLEGADDQAHRRGPGSGRGQPPGSDALSFGLLPVFLVLAVVLAAGSGVVGGLRPRSRLPFTLSMAVAGVCVLLLATAGGSVRG